MAKFEFNIAAFVSETMVDQLGVEKSQITPETRVGEDGLGADSLDTLQLVMAYEDEFGIDIESDEVDDLHTVSDYIAIVEQKLEALER